MDEQDKQEIKDIEEKIADSAPMEFLDRKENSENQEGEDTQAFKGIEAYLEREATREFEA